MFTRADDDQGLSHRRRRRLLQGLLHGPLPFHRQGQGREDRRVRRHLATVAARNYIRSCAGGASAHADHGRGIAYTLLAVAGARWRTTRSRTPSSCTAWRRTSASTPTGKDDMKLAEEVALAALNEFGRQEGVQALTARAPAKSARSCGRRLGVTPRGFDREVVESMHRTHAGTDQDAEHIMDQAVRMCLADGWGGSMLATDLSDILFGTPKPLVSEANLGVLKDDEVNIIIHGHEPTLSELIVDAAQDPEMIEYAKSKGAKGITLAGICCTANEIWMRRGVPPAGNFLHQELAIMTGAVELMVVDIQCVFQGLAEVARQLPHPAGDHIPKAKIEGATHIEFHEEHALRDRQADRQDGHRQLPQPRSGARSTSRTFKERVVAGFSHEYIRYMLGGTFREGLVPLNDNIINGKIQGVAAIVGCNNARATQDEGIINLVRSFIENDVLVVVTGCAAHASGKHGFLTPEMFLEAGPGLSEVCETIGMPPVLHLGSCVDNSRILTILADMVETGGLGDDIDQIPAVGISPEYYCEKALEIATYCVGSGAYVIFGGVDSPVKASGVVTDIHTSGWEQRLRRPAGVHPQVGGHLRGLHGPHPEAKREAWASTWSTSGCCSTWNRRRGS